MYSCGVVRIPLEPITFYPDMKFCIFWSVISTCVIRDIKMRKEGEKILKSSAHIAQNFLL